MIAAGRDLSVDVNHSGEADGLSRKQKRRDEKRKDEREIKKKEEKKK